MTSISVYWIESSETKTHEVKFFQTHGNYCFAHLSDTALVAELDLSKPQEGWKLYPN